MLKKISVVILVFVLIAIAVAALIRIERFPANAKLCGDNWVSCSIIKRGLYHCKIYDGSKRKIKDQIFMYPYIFWISKEPDLTTKAAKYDGEIIYLDGKKRLLPCSIPDDAVLIQGLDGWYWASYVTENQRRGQYICNIYSVKDGGIVSSGLYVLKKHHWDQQKRKTVYENPKDILKYLELFYYGGVGISLKNKMVLMPLGWIDYPTGPRSGLRVSYDEFGNEKNREEY